MPFAIGVMGIGGEKEGNKAPQLYFRQAQRKPTSLDEFKGNVVAVETSPFWDDNLGALQNRMERLNDKLDAGFKKTPKLTREEKDAARKKAVEEQFKPEEVKRLKAGVSNGGYHYLGAARIMAPIGKAFAEALLPTPAAPPKAPAAPTAAPRPVKVFILAGQSNMEGHGFVPADPKRNG